MLYVQQSLGPDEELVHIGKFHWIYTFNAFMAILWGVLGTTVVVGGAVLMYHKLGLFEPDITWLEAVRRLHPGLRIFAFVIFILGLMSFARMMVVKVTTEIAITNSRLIYKRGLIARQVGEMARRYREMPRLHGPEPPQSPAGRPTRPRWLCWNRTPPVPPSPEHRRRPRRS